LAARAGSRRRPGWAPPAGCYAAHGSAAVAKSISRVMRSKGMAEALGVQVTAFLKEPAERPQAGPGRPPKRAAKPAEPPAPKRPRGRPRKER
jgi:hypothetical protein